MHDALDPKTGKLITINKYENNVTAGHYGYPNNPMLAKCPMCNQNLLTRAGQNKGKKHFYHGPQAQNYCWSKDEQSKPYYNLPMGKPNTANAIMLKDFASKNINLLFGEIGRNLPFLDYIEFLKILDEAHKLNAYSYVYLTVNDLPYMLLTLRKFVPYESKNKKRKFTFRFFYSGDPAYDTLWTNSYQNTEFYHTSFKDGKINRTVLIEKLKADRWKAAKFPLKGKQIPKAQEKL